VSPEASEPRPYLRASDRRRQILEAAATLIGQGGLGRLTVAAVAAEAGISRQWVYVHFRDLDDLYLSLVADRFAAIDARIDSAKAGSTGTQLAAFAAREVFAVAPSDRRILRTVLDGSGYGDPELLEVQASLRERVLGRWCGFVRQPGRDDRDARAVVWALVHALFGLADQIEREALDPARAEELFLEMVRAFDGSVAPAHRSRARSPRAAGARS
jgi:AcrR family transcriptional regulator